MKMPETIGLVHFIGIGGIGMSGIAEVLHNLGYRVQGSDQADGANIQRLRDKGIECFVGHRAENIGEAEVVVVSTAIRKSNPELMAAREKLLPIVRRAEMLAELMRFRQAVAIGGTHGKTTTTSMVAALLDAGGLDPTVINGGIINAYGTNARMGAGEWMVVEADESDGTFLKLPAEIAVVTNIDPEHLDHYGNFDRVREAFRQFVENVPFYGFGVMCTDHPEVQAMVSRIEDRRVITYGENAQADVRFTRHAMDGAVSTFDVLIRNRKTGEDQTIDGLRLPMPGRHNVSNATAAIAVAHELGISAEAIRKGLAGFGGVKRRFTATGTWQGVHIFDDYGHHPVEITAVLKAARDATKGRVIAIAQPHRFTRLRDLFDEFSACFNDADTVMVAPVYAAGEDPIDGITSEALAQRIRAGGHRDARFIDGPAAIAPIVRESANSGDFVIFLGAGNITQWAYALPGTRRRAGMNRGEALLSGLGDRLAGVRGRITPNADMDKITWFRAGGIAEALFQPADEDDLVTFLKALPVDVPVMVVGIGSNLLVREGGISGFVVRLSAKGFGDAEPILPTRIRAGAATPDRRVAALALEAGIGGLHFYHGIPGGVGGALRMNAGANGVETRDRVVEVRALDRSGAVHMLSNEAMGYAYRRSGAAADLIFTSATFEGAAEDRATIKAAMDAVQHHRETVQPIREKTGGSTFKNPEGTSAWKEIDRAGCRGLMIGGAQMSPMHCNFMINTGNATAYDLEYLGETVRAKVLEKSGIRLEWEIKRIGRFKPGREVDEFLGRLL